MAGLADQEARIRVRGLCTFITGPKRHVELHFDDEVFVIVERTETGLGGFFVDPSTMPGRAPDGGRLWSLEAVRREMEYQRALLGDPSSLRPPAPWDEPGQLPFPAIRRLSVTTQEVAKTVPEIFRRPGTHYLEGTGSLLRRDIDPSVVAFDPGGDHVDPWALTWYDRRTGEPVRITTDPLDIDAVILDTLDSRAIAWATKRPPAPVESVTVDPMRVRIVGAVSGVIDADLDGLDDPGARRTVYQEVDAAAVVRADAMRLGKREFIRRTGLSEGVAQRAASGWRISERNAATALRELRRDPGARQCSLGGCDEPVAATNARFCSKAHRDRAYRLRRRQVPAEKPADVQNDPEDDTPNLPTCRQCDTVLLGLAAVRGTCSTHSEGA
jgi:hypothetical protein